MILRMLCTAWLVSCLSLSIQAEEGADAKQVPQSRNAISRDSLAVEIDPQAANLEAELRKAELMVRLREKELEAARRDTLEIIRARSKIEAEADRRQQIEERIEAARNRFQKIAQQLEEVEHPEKKTQLALAQQATSEEIEGRQAELRANDNEIASAEITLEQFRISRELEISRAQVALELARVQLETIQQVIVKSKKSRVEREPDRQQNVEQEIAEQKTEEFDPLRSLGVTKQDLAGCQMHIIGLYRASDDTVSDEVFVEVQDLEDPSVIVVSAYNEVLWRLRLTENSKVKLIIVTGYFPQVMTIGGGDTTPKLKLTYFDQEGNPQRDRPWAYAYSWQTAEGRKLARMLYDITGLTASTFQGMENARRLVIDGTRGQLTNRQAKEPIPGLLTDAELAAEPIEFPNEGPIDGGAAAVAALGLDELLASEAGVKLTIRKTADKLQSIESELAAAEAEAEKLAEQLRALEGSSGETLRSRLREAVTRQFELQQQQNGLRANLAGEKLQLVKLRRQLRQQNAEKIIDQMVKSLLR